MNEKGVLDRGIFAPFVSQNAHFDSQGREKLPLSIDLQEDSKGIVISVH